MLSRSIVLSVVMVSTVALMVGCAGNRIDLAEKNQLKVESSSTKNITVPKPSVWEQDGNTIVYGRVARVRGAANVGAGHTHVQIQLPSGAVEEQQAGWLPKWIPYRGPRYQGLHYSIYRAVFPWVAPPDSSVRVWICFDDHPSVPEGRLPSTAPVM